MELTSPKVLKELFEKYGARPSKGLGQNFLTDKNVLQKIIKTAGLGKDDVVLEVGPGFGVLTRELCAVAKKVVAVEKDQTMIEILKETLADQKNIEVINEDILKFVGLPGEYKVVANIPYYLTSPLIRSLLENSNPPKEIILMVQKEVAKRICSGPPDMSLLAVSVQFYATAEIAFIVSRGSFFPAPKVDSAVIKIVPKEKPDTDPELFFRIVKAGFLHPRKQLVNNLTSLKNLNGVKLDKEKISGWLGANDIQAKQRPETLSISDWIKLVKTFKTL